MAELTTNLGISGVEGDSHPMNSSPLDIIRPTTQQKEKENWDMQSYIRSLPTRGDMDKYVHRLETTYKVEN